MSRKYYIQNENGERLDLNGVNGVWFFDASGLGLETDNGFADLGNGFFSMVNAAIPQQTIDGTLLFKGADRARVYQNAVQFLTSAKQLILVFAPISTEYNRRVKVRFLSKGESTRTHIETSISFAVLTPWYLPSPVTLHFSDPAKIDYFAWGVSAWGSAPLAPNNSGKYAAEVYANGHLPAAVRVSLDGRVIDPVITLRGAGDNVVYGRCSLYGTYNGTLVLDTRYSGSSVTVNGVDMLDSLDIDTEPFFRVPLNDSYIIEIESVEFTGEASAELFEYYRSV